MRRIIMPGKVISITDGQQHFISAEDLAGLYQVDIRKCIVVDVRDPRSKGFEILPDDIVLRPKFNGDYPACKCAD